jgi:hypothetical protein
MGSVAVFHTNYYGSNHPSQPMDQEETIRFSVQLRKLGSIGTGGQLLSDGRVLASKHVGIQALTCGWVLAILNPKKTRLNRQNKLHGMCSFQVFTNIVK